MPRFRQRGRPDSATPMRVPESYSKNDSEDHSSEAAHTPPSSDEHPSPSNTGRRTVDQIFQETNLCRVSLGAVAHDDPAYGQLTERLRFLENEYTQTVHEGDRDIVRGRDNVGEFVQDYPDYNPKDYDEHYDKVPEAGNNTQRFMKLYARINGMNSPFISTASALSDIRSPARKLNETVGAMFHRYPESRMPRGRNLEFQSPSHTDDTIPPLVGENIAPSADKDRDQRAEQSARRKWSTVKVKTADKKSNIAHADRSEFPIEDHDPHFQSSAPALEAKEREVEERVSPKLKSFEEVRRQLRQEVLPPYKYSPQQQNYHQPPPPISSWTDYVFRRPEVATSSQEPEYPSCSNGWKNCGTCATCAGGDLNAPWPLNNTPDSKSQDVHRSASTLGVYNLDFPLLKTGITIHDLPGLSDVSNIKVHADTHVVKDGVVIADIPTRKQDQSTTTVAEAKRQAATKMRRIQERPPVFYDDLSNSESESVPVISKLDHPTKASDVKTATGFASSQNPAAPDDSMVDEFLEVANNRFTRDEAFEILRMCGANLIVAVSMYHNAIGPEHLRQMLRAWLAPLENAEFRTAARFYTENLDNQGRPWGVPSEEVGSEEDECQPTPAVMGVSDAFTLLCLSTYNSVDFVTLQAAFRNQLGWQESTAHVQQLQQAYDTIFQHHNDNDCWKLCPAPWTKEMDEKLMRWKTEDVKIKWAAIAEALDVTVDLCKHRFQELQASNEKLNSTKDGASKKQKQKDKVKAASIRTATPDIGDLGASSVGDWPLLHYCEKCDHEYYGLGHDCEADRAAVDGNTPVQGLQSIWDWASEPKGPVSTTYTVTYWATIESGEKTVHIPVDSSNVSGPEKAIIEGSTGMKKVWKWVQEMGLSGRVGLQDAFDLAKNMYVEDGGDKSVLEEPVSVTDASRPVSRSSVEIWG